MPVQINELVIKTTLEREEVEMGKAQRECAKPGTGNVPDEMSVAEIVSEILKEKKER